MNKIRSYIKIIRPLNVIFTIAVVVVACLVSSENFVDYTKILIAAIVAGIVAGAGNVINDIYDLEIDKINRPDRILPSGKLSIKSAYVFYITLIILSTITSFAISINAFLIVLMTNVLLFIYSKKLKSVPLLGNILVAFLTGLAFIYGGVVVQNLQSSIIPALFAFQINLIRELVKDIEDSEGDLKNNVITFANKIGLEKIKAVLLILISILFLTTFIPFLWQIYKIEYFVLIMISVNVILAFIFNKLVTNNFTSQISKMSSLLKLAMLFGLIGIALG